MKKREWIVVSAVKNLVAVCLVTLIGAGHVLAQANSIFLPYLAAGYKYQVASPGSSVTKTFQGSTFNDSSWPTGTAAFGLNNNANPPGCPLNDATHIHVQWPASRDFLERKHITLPANVQNVKVSVALHNDVQVFWNGTDVSVGIQDNDVCASPGNFVFNVPAALLIAGDNVLAVHGIWEQDSDDSLYIKSYLDVQVTGDLPFTITASAGANGTISPSGAVAVYPGASQNFTITPGIGYHVANVLVDGVSVGAVTSYNFPSVSANHTISASFAINVYTITATTGANGGIAPPGVTNVNYGGSQGYTITPNAGYHVADVLVDGVSVGAVTSYNFTNVVSNRTISASFAINVYTITATAGANGGIAPPGVTNVNYGGAQGYTITPNTGYHVADVLVDGVSVGAVTSYNFTGVAANRTISASFAINVYTITATAGANGGI